jgi:hypothetical protein
VQVTVWTAIEHAFTPDPQPNPVADVGTIPAGKTSLTLTAAVVLALVPTLEFVAIRV